MDHFKIIKIQHQFLIANQRNPCLKNTGKRIKHYITYGNEKINHWQNDIFLKGGNANILLKLKGTDMLKTTRVNKKP